MKKIIVALLIALCLPLTAHADNDWYFSQHFTGAQSDLNCGPAVAAMALKWINPESLMDVEDVRDDMGHDGRTTTGQLVEYLDGKEIDSSRVYIETLDEITGVIDNDGIIIALVRNRRFYNSKREGYHFVIIHGYKQDGDTLLVNDPWSTRKEVKWEQLKKSVADTSHEFIMVSKQNNREDEMDRYLTIRISEEMRDEFHAACKEQAINPSELLRKYIREFIERQKAGEVANK